VKAYFLRNSCGNGASIEKAEKIIDSLKIGMIKGKLKMNITEYYNFKIYNMIKAYNLAGNTCYGSAENIDALKPELERLNQCSEEKLLKQPILIYEQDEDSLQRPLFQKIHIAHYKDGWKIK
jgi:hypothetical protein